MMEWDLSPIFGSPLLVLSMLLLGGLSLYWNRLRADLALSRRIVLYTLQIGILLVFLLLSLRPVLSWTTRQSAPRSLAVLVDTSQSMELPSGNGTLSRWEVERKILDDLQKNFSQLGEHWNVKLIAYDSTLRPLTRDSSSLATADSKSWLDALPEAPLGKATDIGLPLANLASSSSEPPLAGVVWLGDGSHSSQGDTQDAQQAAQRLGQLDIPLFLFGIGPDETPAAVRDQIIDGVVDNAEAFADNRFLLRGELRSLGLKDRELLVSAYINQPGNQWKRLTQQKLQPNSGDQVIPFELDIVAPSPGSYEIAVRVEPVDGEITTLNNERICYLEVPSAGARLIYLDGQPNQEQRFIREALAESKNLQIDYRYIPETSRKSWPIKLSQTIDFDKYDCMLLGDLDSEAVDAETWSTIAKRVNSGMGLITLGGFHAYATGGYARTALANVLPIELDATAKQYFDDPIRKELHWPGEIPLIPRMQHPILSLSAESNGPTASGWEQLKPLLGANRWQRLKPQTAAQIIASGPDNQMLIVASEYGQGRVLCLAFDSTYRWRRQGKADLHKRFWRQSVFWTMRREEVKGGIEIVLTSRTHAIGDDVAFEIRWNDEALFKSIKDGMNVRLFHEGQLERTLQVNSAGSNKLQGKTEALAKAGRYELRVDAQRDNGEIATDRVPFIVLDVSPEKLQSNPDWQLIQQLAALNREAGGKVVAPEATYEVIDFLLAKQRSDEIEKTVSYKIGKGFYDSWGLFLLLIGLLSSQWALRKVWNMP